MISTVSFRTGIFVALVTIAQPFHALAQEAPATEEGEGAEEGEDAEEPDLSVHPDPGQSAGMASELVWDPNWGRSDWPNYTMIGAAAAVSLGNIIRAADEENPNLGLNDFDEAGRAALRLPVEQQRLVARDVSDGLLTLMTSWPVLIDALVLAAWFHDSPDIAAEMVFIHAEVIAVTLALQTTANVLLSRQRPYGRTCGGPSPDDLPAESFFCDSPDRYYSFFSGHASQAFASAAVVCSFHMNMPLLEDGPANMIPCVAGFAVAGATAFLRLAGDMHYLTDVITGSLVGTTTGFLLPWLLHFRHRDTRSESNDDVRVTIAPVANGVGVMGVW